MVSPAPPLFFSMSDDARLFLVFLHGNNLKSLDAARLMLWPSLIFTKTRELPKTGHLVAGCQSLLLIHTVSANYKYEIV